MRVCGHIKTLSISSSIDTVHTTRPPLGHPSGLGVLTQAAQLVSAGQTREEILTPRSRLRMFGQGIPEISEP